MCSFLNLLRFIGGLLSVASLGVGGYFYANHYNELDCGDMKLGITLGLSSIILFLVNILTYASSCNKWWIVSLCGLFLMGSTGYNIYITDKIDEECKQNYIDKNIWSYYIYMYVAMIFLSVIFLLLCFVKYCCGSKD